MKSGEIGVALSDGGGVKRIVDQGAGHHLCQRRAAPVRGVGTRAMPWQSPGPSIRPRTKSFKRSMPSGPGGLPPAGCSPRRYRAELSSWKRWTRRNHQVEDLRPQGPNADKKASCFNGQPTFREKPVTLAELNTDDRLKVQYDYQESINVANKVEALRLVELQGVLAEDYDGHVLSVINGQPAKWSSCRSDRST